MRVRQREGCVLRPYRDSVGVWTDGVGNTNGVIPNGPPITQEKADADLRRNLRTAEDAINAQGLTLTQNQFDALVSFTFNVGVGAFRSSTMLRLLHQGDIEGASAQFPRWNIPAEIIERRAGERQQFDTPD